MSVLSRPPAAARVAGARDGAGRDTRLGPPLAASALLHGALAAAIIWATRPGPPVILPPVYRVNIVAAPPGPRAIGVVGATRTPEKPAAAPPRMREVAPKTPAAPVKRPAPAPVRATPTTSPARPTSATRAPRAGGGPTGGRGTDVATVQTQGIDFPYPGYLNNIVRQIALNFLPNNPNAPLRAEVAFIIHRDGSVTSFRFLTRSGSYAFDLAAQGAVEKAARAFGPLPAGFPDDVLPVVFTFDPRFLR